MHQRWSCRGVNRFVRSPLPGFINIDLILPIFQSKAGRMSIDADSNEYAQTRYDSGPQHEQQDNYFDDQYVDFEMGDHLDPPQHLQQGGESPAFMHGLVRLWSTFLLPYTLIHHSVQHHNHAMHPASAGPLIHYFFHVLLVIKDAGRDESLRASSPSPSPSQKCRGVGPPCCRGASGDKFKPGTAVGRKNFSGFQSYPGATRG